MPHIRRALISVSDKRGLIEFAKALQRMGVEIISTGGTHAALKEHGVNVETVSDVTNFPEILDGRVKTLHPKIHAGLLALVDNERHSQQLKEHGIDEIDMVVANLYPFERTISQNGIPIDTAMEQVDIGGPAMVRAAAKNFKNKVVIVNPDRYPDVISEMEANNGIVSESTCFALAKEVFRHTSSYDTVIANYLDHVSRESDRFPHSFYISLTKNADLRYGENPHQHAALYGNFGAFFQQLHGKALSYNNIVDITAAAILVADFDEPTVAIVKHSNPCGVGSDRALADAYSKALATDAKSAFGGIIAMNKQIDVDAAEKMNEIFSEVIVAPEFPEPVLALLRKKKDRRLIRITADLRSVDELNIRSVPGGLLVQEPDRARTGQEELKVVTKRKPRQDEIQSMLYAWKVTKHVKSNSIVYARQDRTLGIGAGQMSRIDSARIATQKASEAGLDLTGSAIGSDAFFPFPDGLLEAVKAGSTAVIQPGGSIRDEEVIQAANDNDITMVFTGVRHFKH